MVHYELLREQQEKQLRRIVEYLGLELEERRLQCSLQHHFGTFKRLKPKLQKSPYGPEATQKIEETIALVQFLLIEYGHEPLPLNLYSKF